MGDQIDVEEIMAEEEEISFIQELNIMISTLRTAGLVFVSAYGWHILVVLIGIYFLWKSYGHHLNRALPSTNAPLSEREISQFKSKEEARERYIARLQEQYEKEATVRAEKTKQKEEEKRKARLAELEKLTGSSGGGRRLGSKDDKTKSLRPEYNPLMGDTTTYNRPCNSRSSGRSGG